MTSPPRIIGYPSAQPFWDPNRSLWKVHLSPGDLCISDRDDLVMTTCLGSCISACIWDEKRGIGGMNHFLLPIGEQDRFSAKTARYGSNAMELLINDLLKYGAWRSRLKAKIFGGGRMLGLSQDIGGRNIEFTRDYIEREGLTLMAESVGGNQARRLEFHPVTGRARAKSLGMTEQVKVQEETFLRKVAIDPAEGEIELF
jgi:chemotaxis protein CheD